jgi:membrane fusion protein
VDRGQRVLQLMPEGSQLEAELWLPSEAIGMIEVEAQVRLRLRPFPFRSFGLHSGRVRSIAAVALTEAASATHAGTSGSRSAPPRYRVRVALASQTVRAPDGSLRPLRAGMQVDADVLLESRPLYQALWPQLARPRVASQEQL